MCEKAAKRLRLENGKWQCLSSGFNVRNNLLTELIEFMRGNSISLVDVRAKLVPVMLEYKLHDKML